MSNTEIKEILVALCSTRDLIATLNDGRKLPAQLVRVFRDLVEDANLISGMIEEDNHD